MVKGQLETRSEEIESHPIGNIPLVPPAPLRKTAFPKAGTKVKVKEEVTKENLAKKPKRFLFWRLYSENPNYRGTWVAQ